LRFFLVLALAFSCIAVYAQQDDRLLNILQGELNREIAGFSKTAQLPYFIDYRVNDEEQALITSSFGSLTQSFLNRERLLNVHVRLGDYTIDNTHPQEDDRRLELGLGTESPPHRVAARRERCRPRDRR